MEHVSFHGFNRCDTEVFEASVDVVVEYLLGGCFAFLSVTDVRRESVPLLWSTVIITIIIIIMENCKAPTLRLKVLNMHNITHTHNVHRDGNVISNKNEYKKKRKS